MLKDECRPIYALHVPCDLTVIQSDREKLKTKYGDRIVSFYVEPNGRSKCTNLQPKETLKLEFSYDLAQKFSDKI